MARPTQHSDATTVLITGAAGGIGRATAGMFVQRGYHVVGLDRRWPDTACHPQVTADMSEPQEYSQMIAAIEEEHGALGVLVNNAGLYLGKSWDEITQGDAARVLAVNVVAPLMLSQAVGASMRTRSGGSIVNVASISARSPGHDPVYAASKAALVALTTALSADLAPHGIRVNAVAPGLVDTAMTDVIPADVRAGYRARVPLGRFGTPDEVAEVIGFLADPASSYVAGAVIGVDGALR